MKNVSKTKPVSKTKEAPKASKEAPKASKSKEKLAHYQVIFTTLEEAQKDAKEQSKKQERRLYIIQSRNLFFVDSESRVREKETILGCYENGKKAAF